MKEDGLSKIALILDLGKLETEEITSNWNLIHMMVRWVCK